MLFLMALPILLVRQDQLLLVTRLLQSLQQVLVAQLVPWHQEKILY
jgi:hypothetical protein